MMKDHTSEINNIEYNAFAGMESLKELDLSGNELEYFNVSDISKLEKLIKFFQVYIA